MPRLNALLGVALALFLVSCRSNPNRSFEVRTIDTEGKQVPCVILVEGSIYPDPENPELPLVTNNPDKRLDLTFKLKDDGTYDVLEVRVQALRQDPETKKPIPGSWKTEPNPYLMTESTRRLRHNDPEMHLFILRRNPDFQ